MIDHGRANHFAAGERDDVAIPRRRRPVQLGNRIVHVRQVHGARRVRVIRFAVLARLEIEARERLLVQDVVHDRRERKREIDHVGAVALRHRRDSVFLQQLTLADHPVVLQLDARLLGRRAGQFDAGVLNDAVLARRVLAPAPEIGPGDPPPERRRVRTHLSRIDRRPELAVVPRQIDASVVRMIVRRQRRHAFTRRRQHRVETRHARRRQRHFRHRRLLRHVLEHHAPVRRLQLHAVSDGRERIRAALRRLRESERL